MTELSFDELAEEFDERRGLPPAAFSALVSLIGEIAQGRRLDVIEPGIGTGRIALAGLESGHRVTGVDLSAPMLAAYRAALRDCTMLVRADARRLPFPASSFDLAILASVLYLIPQWRSALEETISVLRPDGALIAVFERSTPSPDLARWDALWRSRIEETGYRHAPMQPDDDALIAALRERCSRVDVRILASWTIGQTVGAARAALGGLRSLYGSVPDHGWEAALRAFETGADRAFDDPGVRLDCDVRLEVAVCHGFGRAPSTSASAGKAPHVGQ